jgi:hypothetical protein
MIHFKGYTNFVGIIVSLADILYPSKQAIVVSLDFNHLLIVFEDLCSSLVVIGSLYDLLLLHVDKS